jgi:signal transduction histidine kinase
LGHDSGAEGQEDWGRLGHQLTFRSVYAYVAHEINHPLGTIANLASLLERRIHDPVVRPSEMTEHLEAIKQETRRAADVIRQLRVLAGGLQGHVQPINCRDFLRDAVTRFRRRYPRGVVDIRVDCADRALTMEGVTELLHIALYNLMVNGTEAAQAAKVERPRLTLCAETLDGAVVLDVLDNGAGVDAEIAPRLFEPFVSGKEDGSGLGLAISRDIIEWHGGKISYENGTLRGDTRFRLTTARRLRSGDKNERSHLSC